MTLVAFMAVALAVGAWWGFRWAEETHRLNDLTTYLLSIPADEWESEK